MEKGKGETEAERSQRLDLGCPSQIWDAQGSVTGQGARVVLWEQLLPVFTPGGARGSRGAKGLQPLPQLQPSPCPAVPNPISPGWQRGGSIWCLSPRKRPRTTPPALPIVSELPEKRP